MVSPHRRPAAAPPSQSPRGARFAAAVIAAVHLGFVAINVSPLLDLRSFQHLFDMNGEGNVVVWVSATTFAAIAALLVGCGFASAERRERTGWWVIGAGFGLLSLDETAGVHELIGELVSWRIFSVDWLPGGFLWLAVVAPLLVVGALLIVLWFRRHVGWNTLPGQMTFAAMAVWCVVLVAEGLAPTLPGTKWLAILEEGLEGLGSALMFGAAVHLASSRYSLAVRDSASG
jgi:hypothetical protein